MASSAARQARLLEEVLKIPGNNQCADCKSTAPRWASVNLGVFLCVQCASVHRKLGTHNSRVRSVTMDTWTREQVDTMRSLGNTLQNSLYNPNPTQHPPPTSTSEFNDRDSELEKYIRKKWVAKAFMNKGRYEEEEEDRGAERGGRGDPFPGRLKPGNKNVGRYNDDNDVEEENHQRKFIRSGSATSSLARRNSQNEELNDILVPRREVSKSPIFTSGGRLSVSSEAHNHHHHNNNRDNNGSSRTGLLLPRRRPSPSNILGAFSSSSSSSSTFPNTNNNGNRIDTQSTGSSSGGKTKGKSVKNMVDSNWADLLGLEKGDMMLPPLTVVPGGRGLRNKQSSSGNGNGSGNGGRGNVGLGMDQSKPSTTTNVIDNHKLEQERTERLHQQQLQQQQQAHQLQLEQQQRQFQQQLQYQQSSSTFLAPTPMSNSPFMTTTPSIVPMGNPFQSHMSPPLSSSTPASSMTTPQSYLSPQTPNYNQFGMQQQQQPPLMNGNTGMMSPNNGMGYSPGLSGNPFQAQMMVGPGNGNGNGYFNNGYQTQGQAQSQPQMQSQMQPQLQMQMPSNGMMGMGMGMGIQNPNQYQQPYQQQQQSLSPFPLAATSPYSTFSPSTG